VIAGFRKMALHQAGYWSQDMLTEDITMTARALDLAKEIERFGADTLSGIGVSRARPVDF